MHTVLDRFAALPRSVSTVAVVMAAGPALLAVCAMLMWMIVHPRRARARLGA